MLDLSIIEESEINNYVKNTCENLTKSTVY